MYRRFRTRLAALAAACVWTAAVLLQAAAPVVAELLPAGEPVVEREAIRIAGAAQATCGHHPAGCPSDCFCPKQEPRAARDADAPGSLREAAWEECSQTRSVSMLIPVGFPVAVPPEIALFFRSEPLPGVRAPVHPDPFRSPPEKVPIG